MLGAGLHEKQFQEIAKIAIQIWKFEGYDQYECTNLVAYMRLFREKKNCPIVLTMIRLCCGG